MRSARWSALGLRPDPQRHLSLSLASLILPTYRSYPRLILRHYQARNRPFCLAKLSCIHFFFSLDFTYRHHQVGLGCHSFSSVIHVIVLKVLHGVRRFVHCGSRRRSPGYLLACPLVSTFSHTISLRSFRRTLGNARLLFRCHRPVNPIPRRRQCIQRNPS